MDRFEGLLIVQKQIHKFQGGIGKNEQGKVKEPTGKGIILFAHK